MEHQLFLESQFLNPNFADIHFIVADANEQTVKIPAHKVILAASSPFLQKYFSDNADLQKVELANTSVAALKEFLFTFYSVNTEKYFTIENAPIVLTLAKQFGAIRCIKSFEKFLMKNLSIGQICFGYALAMEHNLGDLKASCKKIINERTFEVFTSQTFYGCNQHILYDILSNLSVTQLEAKKVVWDACMLWAEKQCANGGMDLSNLKIRRNVLGKCFDSIMSIVSKDGEFKNYVMEHYAALFNDDELQDTLSTTIVCNPDCNQNEIIELETARFADTMLATQLFHANDPVLIVLKSTKKIVLNGVALSTIIGIPDGKLTISLRANGTDVQLIEQKIMQKTKRRDPRNYIPIENVILEPHQDYTIKLQLTKDVVYYQSRLISNVYNANGFTVSFHKELGRDIFSHFFFNDCF